MVQLIYYQPTIFDDIPSQSIHYLIEKAAMASIRSQLESPSSLTTTSFRSSKININLHSYANDIQIHLNCTDSSVYCPNIISNCISKYHNCNSLKFNRNKIKSILLHNMQGTYPVAPHTQINHY